MNERKWYLRTQDETFGPETRETLVSWAKMGRIQPGQEVSDDNVIWTKVEDVPFLDMRFSIDIGDGNPRGPFNQAAADALIASGRLPAAAKVVETRAPFPPEEAEEPKLEGEEESKSGVEVEEQKPEVEQQDLFAQAEPCCSTLAVEEPAPTAAEETTSVRQKEETPEPEETTSVRQQEEAKEPCCSTLAVEETPAVVEKIVEKIVEVPVEKIVEKEVRVEVPVEKIVEKIVTVVDDTRVKELEGLLSEERDRVASLQAKLDESSKLASEQRSELARLDGEIKNGAEREKALSERIAEREKAMEANAAELNEKFEKAVKDATDREAKLNEQVLALEDELRRLPQAASEVADIQAAMYGIMTKEADEINALLSVEKAEMEEFRKRSEARCDRLLERRRELLKRSGANIEDMTRKALVDRPEDPRTAQLRRELDELRRIDEKKTLDAMKRIRDLEEQVRERDGERTRTAEGLKDVTELRRENQQLKERLQSRERELMELREQAEQIRQREAASQQALVARLKDLESPAIGAAASTSPYQSREAKSIKMPSWMHLGIGR